MKRKLLILLMLLIYFVTDTSAQSSVITGRITDATSHQPIPGVSVRKQGTTVIVSTNADGQFKIEARPADVLQFDYIGYLTQKVTVGNQQTLSISLSPSDSQLNEVVVTGYGSTQKKAFTGTASTITNEQFKDLQVTTITGILQGNASGVIAVDDSGQPGESPTIRIRGIGSFNASNDPLILLDGAPFNGSLNSINPADIESLTVLKDASSTSIYGSRAANGILQIVSKKGKGKPKFQFSSVVGAATRAVKEYKTVDAAQYYELTWEALRNDAITDPTLLKTNSAASPADYATSQVVNKLIYNPFNVAQPVGLDGKLAPGAALRYSENWMDAMTRVGLRKDLNASVSGSDATNKTSYFIGGGSLQDQGIIQDSQFKRYSGRVNVQSKINDWFEVGVTSNLSKSDQNYPYQGTAYASNVLGFARNIAPIYPVHLVDPQTGQFVLDGNGNKIYDFGNNTAVLGQLRPNDQVRPYSAGQNVAATTSLNPNTFSRLTGSALGFANIKFSKELSFRSQYSLNYNQEQNDVFWNPFYGDGTTSNGYAFRGITNLTSQNFTNSFNFDKTIGIHHLNLIAGMESFKQVTEYTNASRTGFTFADPKQVSYGTTSTADGYKDEFRLESFFGRANYDVNNKYHLSLSLRTDGSSRFADGHRWGTFYAVGTSWNINDEDFLKDSKTISTLKAKASYGTSGNQALPGSFPYLGTYSAGANIGTASGSVINTVSNPDLTWETQKQLDLGIEFGLLKDRFTGSLVYFNRRSSNLLFARPLPNSSGVSSIDDNVGGVKNYGFELELNSANVTTKNFSWRTSLNITKLSNKITQIAPGTTQRLGGSWYDFYIQEYAGVDKSDGSPMWYKDDVNGNKVTTKVYGDASRYYIGNRLSDYTGGLTNSLKYKNFDFSVLTSFAIGGKYYDANYAALMGGIAGTGNNASVDVSGRWQSPENPGDGKTPKLTTIPDESTSPSSRFLFSHTYARVRNITLGYNFSSVLLEKIKVRNARVYFDAQNMFTFFGGPKGSDPDAGINAQASNSNTSANKFLSVGLNLSL